MAPNEIVKHYKEQQFQTNFMDCTARFPCFVAAWGTGKTMYGLFKVIEHCKRYPNNLWVVVRKERTDLHDSTMKDFTDYTGIPISSDHNVVFDNDSTLMFRHGSELDVLQNMNLGGFLIEQAEEFDTDAQFQMLRGRMRRAGVPHQGVVIANAKGHNWIWKSWIKKDLPVPNENEIKELIRDTGMSRRDLLDAFDPEQYAAFQATTFDNKANLPPDFLADVVRLRKEAPKQYNRLVMNSHEDLDLDDKVIPYSTIMSAINRTLTPFRIKRLVTCDPAEFGNDESVIYVLESGKIIDRDIFSRKEPMETAGRIMVMRNKHKANTAVLDNIGVGSGIASRLRELKCPVIMADSRIRKGVSPNYFNRRAEMWFAARDRFVEGTTSIPDDDARLHEELAAIGYTIDSKGVRKIHPKENIRKANYLGHSPGRAEALVYGLWAEKLISYDDELVGLAEDQDTEQTNLAESYNVVSVI